jgi:arginine:pyruvate transaminase
MKLSHRITHITGSGSDGWDLYRKARALVNSGTPVVELTIGEHDIRTDPLILDRMHRSALGGHTGYPGIPGIPSLRKAVAARIQSRTGVPTDMDNVLITAGGQGALFASHQAACDEGDRALFIDPFYATYPGTVRSVGGVPVPVRARAEDGFQPRPEDIAVHAKGAKSLLINSPNNPTGAVYSRSTLEGICGVVKDHDLWLISDEVYDTQVWSGAHLSPRALPGMAERTLVIGSLSKSHAMTGSRIGWVCGPAEAIRYMLDLATNTNYGIPGFIQDAGLHALSLGPEFEAGIAAPFLRRSKITAELLAGQNVIRSLAIEGAMYVMLDVSATGLDGESFAEALLEQERIAVMPGSSFGAAAAAHVRVAMTVPDTDYAKALGRLLGFAASLAHRNGNRVA